MVKPGTVLLIFAYRKVVLTGAKEQSESYESFENIYSILKGFKNPECIIQHLTIYWFEYMHKPNTETAGFCFFPSRNSRIGRR